MKENLCMGCMSDKGTAEVCPHCGYAENSLCIPTYLVPRSVLGKRYLVGRVLSYNGEGVTYMGYDAVLERKVEIREYFPESLVTRAEDGRSVNVRPNCQISFKANMSDFIEVKEKLSRIHTLSCLQQVWGIIEENQTIYAVQEHVDGVLLRDHLERRGLMYSWEEASDLLLPMIRTLSLVHQEGIIHRGVSPSTVWVTGNGTVKLGGFSISAVRAARTELPAELFPGYSAPEQYSTVSPHGPWTDVYAVAALLYTCVTGQCPPEALVRSSARELPPPRECNETVSPRNSLAILQGLSISPDDRIRSLSDFVGRIGGVSRTNGGDSPTITIPAAKVPSSPASQPASAPSQTQTIPITISKVTTVKASAASGNGRKIRISGGSSDRRLMINTMLITLPILLLVLIFTFWYLFGDRRDDKTPSSETASLPSSSVSETVSSSVPSENRPSTSWPSKPFPEGSSADSSESYEVEKLMVSLVGLQYDAVLANEDYMELFTLEEPEYIFSESDEEGTIVWQSISAHSPIEPGASVRVKISKGSQYIDIPPYEKRTMEEYTETLDELGIRYVIAYKDDTPYPAGFVAGYSSPNGSQYDISKSTVIQVYVSNKR